MSGSLLIQEGVLDDGKEAEVLGILGNVQEVKAREISGKEKECILVMTILWMATKDLTQREIVLPRLFEIPMIIDLSQKELFLQKKIITVLEVKLTTIYSLQGKVMTICNLQGKVTHTIDQVMFLPDMSLQILESLQVYHTPLPVIRNQRKYLCTAILLHFKNMPISNFVFIS